MKTQFITYCSILLFSICFISCSNDDNNLDQEGPELSAKGDAIMFSYQDQSFRDSLNLQLIFPAQDTITSKSNRWVYLGFYNESEKNEWYSIPGVRQEKNYKIYNEHEKDSSNPELVKFKIITEQAKSSESYGNTLNYKELKIIAIKPEAIRNLTPADLDFKDFFAVMDYFGLNKE
ncbi:hypothetical protein ED312_15460 [Sinomicrobium pectinilyticum]|uniref:Uncharacterized protein n=1 Tax=Sinomicrobium pectinilyticum TaxID=1084421 RepID=A0A3N0E5F4_SINP1|nr:hypothetical protein [Sinomicrobium pectinilyticum]RNL83065.1 hypothetical protein ED312_15460 [Sinomicrobium pectinilyticum]